MNSDRLEKLESRLAFQEHSVEELSEEVSRQQLRLNELTETVGALVERLRQLARDDGLTGPIGDEKPPHY